MLRRNRCDQTVYIYQSNNGSCDMGQDKVCSSNPWSFSAGTKGNKIEYISDGIGSSIKIALDTTFGKILQVEYNDAPDALYWDLSNLDGKGPSVTGTPFADKNVELSPSGAGVGTGTCVPVKCAANQICTDAYQQPNDPNTKVSSALQIFPVFDPRMILTTTSSPAQLPPDRSYLICAYQHLPLDL